MADRLLLITGLVALAAAQCYYPDGSEASDRRYEPCGGINTTFSTCCVFSEGEECLPNGLCMHPGHYDYRAACDNRDWEGCAAICPTASSDGWVQVEECTADEYCCNTDRNGNCCEDGTDRFSLEERFATSSFNSPSISTLVAASSTATETADATKSEFTDLKSRIKRDGTPSDKKSSSTPVGLIAVGVVGGVAVMGALGIGLRAFLRRKKAALAAALADDKEIRPKPAPRSEESTNKETRRPKKARRPSGRRRTMNWVVETNAGPDHEVAEVDSRPVERRGDVKDAETSWAVEMDAGPRPWASDTRRRFSSRLGLRPAARASLSRQPNLHDAESWAGGDAATARPFPLRAARLEGWLSASR
ncbi:hypothetical protein G7Z17_g4742 [Cylindrodendrum hubeiense]|uniref:Uncharacterized protein n=1 Tax=Cylindrodendrum hubeiense TaxID=595255 RepID=A0A9P5HC75_9HYPO|nr:hypothetical protein G7Z17_g4742 [Cylindrodendrum hubeiense]